MPYPSSHISCRIHSTHYCTLLPHPTLASWTGTHTTSPSTCTCDMLPRSYPSPTPLHPFLPSCVHPSVLICPLPPPCLFLLPLFGRHWAFWLVGFFFSSLLCETVWFLPFCHFVAVVLWWVPAFRWQHRPCPPSCLQQQQLPVDARGWVYSDMYTLSSSADSSLPCLPSIPSNGRLEPAVCSFTPPTTLLSPPLLAGLATPFSLCLSSLTLRAFTLLKLTCMRALLQHLLYTHASTSAPPPPHTPPTYPTPEKRASWLSFCI